MNYISDADSMGLASVCMMQLAPKAVAVCEIMWAIQDHSKSPILVAIESE